MVTMVTKYITQIMKILAFSHKQNGLRMVRNLKQQYKKKYLKAISLQKEMDKSAQV